MNVKKINLLLAASAVLFLASTSDPRGTASGSLATISSAADARKVVDEYCVTCHNDRLETAGMSLQTTDLADVFSNGERLEKMVRKLRAGTMPPISARRPDSVTSASLALWLEAQLDQASLSHPNPGRTESLHRLNRLNTRTPSGTSSGSRGSISPRFCRVMTAATGSTTSRACSA
jgi:mono/diheme cytochrome c family protein